MGKSLNDKLVNKVGATIFNSGMKGVTVANNTVTSIASWTTTSAGFIVVIAQLTFDTVSSTGIRKAIIYRGETGSPGDTQVGGTSAGKVGINVCWTGQVSKNEVISVRAQHTYGSSMYVGGCILGILFTTG